jgi:hypothetical protein
MENDARPNGWPSDIIVIQSFAERCLCVTIPRGSCVCRLARNVLCFTKMATTERRNRGDYVPGVDAEKSRAERRRNIMQAVEKRLDGLQSAALASKVEDPNQPTSRPAKRKRSSRVQGFFRL